MSNLLSKLARTIVSPDPALIEAAAGGERFTAYGRLAFWVLLAMAPGASIASVGGNAAIEVWMTFGACLAGLTFAAVFLAVLRRRSLPQPLTGFVTSAIDVSVVSVSFAGMVLAGQPYAVTNNQVAWAGYLLMIMATVLRFDMRICLTTGALAMIQYALLATWVTVGFDGKLINYSRQATESVSLLVQVGRLMLMLAAMGLAAAIIYRCQLILTKTGIDRLTGLANRAYFAERLSAELARSARTGAAVALAVFDVDHFKRFNDRFGHDAGDEVLRLVADTIAGECRKQDVPARWGGEELAIIMPDTEPHAAAHLADRIRVRLAERRVTFDGEQTGVTVSCGIAACPADAIDPDGLFKVADARLYRAKRDGRNRVVGGDEPAVAGDVRTGSSSSPA